MSERCEKVFVCNFYRRKIPIHDSMYKTNIQKYCEGDFSKCAIYTALEKVNILNMPKDLYPNQTFRIKDIIDKHHE